MIQQLNDSLVSRGRRDSRESSKKRACLQQPNDSDDKKNMQIRRSLWTLITDEREMVALTFCVLFVVGFILLCFSWNTETPSRLPYHQVNPGYPLETLHARQLVPKSSPLWTSLIDKIQASGEKQVAGHEAATVFLQLVFGHLLPHLTRLHNTQSPLDLRPPSGSQELLRILEKAARWNVSHCSDGISLKLLLKASDVLADLVEKQCQQLPLPLILLRRIFVAVLIVISNLDEGEAESQACHDLARRTSISVFKSFERAVSCSRSKRTALEYYHISKAGGTSFCQLAREAGKIKNPSTEVAGNCMVPGLQLEPRWTRMEPGLSDKIVWAAVECPKWQEQREMSCDQMDAALKEGGYDFFANEVALHLAPGSNVSQHCPQFESLVIIRDPVQRARSHVVEIIKTYKSFSMRDQASLLARRHNPYTRSRNLVQWKESAPAVIDNYQTRWLLGRHYLHCRDFGTLKEEDLLSASISLLAIDHIPVMEDSYLNDVVLQLGIGWPKASLSRMHYRYATDQDIVGDLGFTPDSNAFLQDHQRLDSLLHLLGRFLLRLDVSFHAGVAALSGKLQARTCNKSLQECDSLGHSRQIDFETAIKMAGYKKVNLARVGRHGHGSAEESTRVIKRAGGKGNVTPGIKAEFQGGYINIDQMGNGSAADHRSPHLIRQEMIPFNLMARNQTQILIWDPTERLYIPLGHDKVKQKK